MSENQDIAFSADLRPGGKEELFENLNDFQIWLNVEREFWNWMEVLRQKNPNAHHYINSYYQRLNQIQAHLEATLNNTNIPHHRGQLIQVLQNYYQKNQLIHSSQPRAKFLKEIFEKDPAHAVYTLKFFIDRRFNQDTPGEIEGSFSALLFEHNVKDSNKGETKALEELRDLWQIHLNNSKTDLTNITNDYANTLIKLQDQKNEEKKKFEELLGKAEKEHEQRIEKVKQRFKEIEDLYEKKLALHASIKYWGEKAKSHFRWSIGFTIATLGGFYIAGNWLYNIMRSVIGNATIKDLEVWKIGLLLIAATIGVWITRVLIRLLLSNVHLWNDANERRTMIQTYLALHNEGKMPDQSRELILQALFRPTSTGIVKDDAAPPFMAEWLKRTTGAD